MKKIELLAPAGSLESLYAAVQSGADAVYLGGSKFSARAYASNFDENTMRKSLEYAHMYGVKVYITLNTLIKENELEEAFNYIKFLYEIGVDALIIQDMGIARMMQKAFPEFEIHASTQMTIHNGEGALLLKNYGFKRIVLSRELSLKEIEYISKQLSVDTEIFIHGALCICYSGQCLMSSLIGGRSGNRGRCAQPCRLPYTLINKTSGRESSAYILSPKDICTLEDIKTIINSGTSSLKIEGRMKRPEYVAGVVEVYRKAIESVYESKEFNFQEENRKLLKLFNREGFSKAYMFGNVGKDMMAYSFPKNTGTVLGSAGKGLYVTLEDDIRVKDGIRVNEEGFTVSNIIMDNVEVKEARMGDRVKLIPSNYKVGDILYKTADTSFLSSLAEVYSQPFFRKLQLPLKVYFKVGSPIVLKTQYDNKVFSVNGETVQTAVNKPLDKNRVMESLTKAGDTAYKFGDIEFESFEEGFLPVSSINSARRELIDSVEKFIRSKHERLNKVSSFKSVKHSEEVNSGERSSLLPPSLVTVNNSEALRAALESGMQNVGVNIFTRKNDIVLEDLLNEGANIYLKIPNIIKEEFHYICGIIEKHLPNIKGIITGNLGIIHRFKDKTNIIGDYKLNIFNSLAVDFYSTIISGASISLELKKKEIWDIIKACMIMPQFFIYGRPESMVSEYCPIGSVFGSKCKDKDCRKECEEGSFVLKDRKGEEFVVTTDRFCRSYIYNNSPINLIGNIEELKKMGIQSFRLDFIDEDYDEVKRVLNSFKLERWEDDFEGYTRGHYKRGVE